MRDEQGHVTRDDLETASRTDEQPAAARRTTRKSPREPARGAVPDAARQPMQEFEPGPESGSADLQRLEDQISEEEIRERAYELYRMRGGEDGLDQADWLAAEQELRMRPRREPPGGSHALDD